MRPTVPTAVAPAPAAPAPAVVAPVADWRALTIELLTVVELRPRLQDGMLQVVNKIRRAAGLPDRVEGPTAVAAPEPGVQAAAPIGRVLPAVVAQPELGDEEVFGAEDIIDERDAPHRAQDDADDEPEVEVVGRGIVEGDDWLRPFENKAPGEDYDSIPARGLNLPDVLAAEVVAEVVREEALPPAPAVGIIPDFLEDLYPEAKPAELASHQKRTAESYEAERAQAAATKRGGRR